MADLFRLEDDFLFLGISVFVVGDKDVVIDFLIEVQVSKCLLVGRLSFQNLLQLFNIQLADRIQVFVYLSDYYLLLL